MRDEGLSEEQKQEKRIQHALKETEFLRLKRSRLGVEDFMPLKVIGRGAFGEGKGSRIDVWIRSDLTLDLWFLQFAWCRKTTPATCTP